MVESAEVKGVFIGLDLREVCVNDSEEKGYVDAPGGEQRGTTKGAGGNSGLER
jgi:hypothetical protein